MPAFREKINRTADIRAIRDIDTRFRSAITEPGLFMAPEFWLHTALYQLESQARASRGAAPLALRVRKGP